MTSRVAMVFMSFGMTMMIASLAALAVVVQYV